MFSVLLSLFQFYFICTVWLSSFQFYFISWRLIGFSMTRTFSSSQRRLINFLFLAAAAAGIKTHHVRCNSTQSQFTAGTRMKYLSTLLFFVLLALLSAAQGQQTQPLENIDVDSTLRNDKLVRRYIDCVLDRGRCDRNGNDLKGKIFRFVLLVRFC